MNATTTSACIPCGLTFPCSCDPVATIPHEFTQGNGGPDDRMFVAGLLELWPDGSVTSLIGGNREKEPTFTASDFTKEDRAILQCDTCHEWFDVDNGGKACDLSGSVRCEPCETKARKQAGWPS